MSEAEQAGQQGHEGEAGQSTTTAYEVLGGEARLKALVDRFYALMDSEPEYQVIRKLHPPSLAGSNDKLYLFLTGWLGGPPVYVQKYGHPMLRARHLPFAIDQAARREWLRCFEETLEGAEDRYGFPAAHLPNFRGFLREFSAWMVNREG